MQLAQLSFDDGRRYPYQQAFRRTLVELIRATAKGCRPANKRKTIRKHYLRGCKIQEFLKISQLTIPSTEKAFLPGTWRAPLLRNSHVGTPHPATRTMVLRSAATIRIEEEVTRKEQGQAPVVFLAPYTKGFQKHNFPEGKGRTQHTMLVFAHLSFLKGALWPSSWQIHWKFLKISQTPKCIIPQLSGPMCEQASKLP